MVKTTSKKMRNLVLYFSWIVLLCSCESAKPDWGMAKSYFPDYTLLKDGIVNKYYIHTLLTDAYNPSTIIEYRQFILKKPNELTVNLYNAAFEMTRSTQYLIEDNQVSMAAMQRIFRVGTFDAEILDSVFYDWNSQSATTETRTTYNNGGIYTVLSNRKLAGDTTILGRPIKVVMGTQTSTYQIDGSTNAPQKLQIQEYYAPGIGLFGYNINFSGGTHRLELVEQIPQKVFQKMAKHSIKRVAYIDPTQVMDQGNELQLCDNIQTIADYYNGGPNRAGYTGGKKALWSNINAQVDQSKLFQESGFLTFRFVINCKGETGWYVTEEADFDYQKKQFNEVTVQHLYEIVSQLDEWRPCIARGEERDSYFYLTFKLDHGAIIEILP